MLHLITCHGRIMPCLAELLLKKFVGWGHRVSSQSQVNLLVNLFMSPNLSFKTAMSEGEGVGDGCVHRVSSQVNLLPPTSKMLEEHIASGAFVHPSIHSSHFLMHCIIRMCMLLF